MPEKRSPNKKYVGAWMPMGLAAGIEVWLKRHPEKDRTVFLIEASLNHLASHGIIITLPPESSVGRPRKQIPESAYDAVHETTTPYKVNNHKK